MDSCSFKIAEIRRLLGELEEQIGDSRVPPVVFAQKFMTRPSPLPYTRDRDKGFDVWDGVREADAGEDPERIRLLYSGYEIDPGPRDDEYSHGWTREHVWPKSRGGGMDTGKPGIATDMHNIFAADTSVNSARSNKHFSCLDDCDSRQVYDNSPARGQSGVLLAKTSVDAWEPPDSTKGAIARAMMYMACMYGDTLRLVDNVTTGGSCEAGKLTDILEWNSRFPPGRAERRRNDVIERYQGNRNPFIDDPRSADAVRWGE